MFGIALLISVCFGVSAGWMFDCSVRKERNRLRREKFSNVMPAEELARTTLADAARRLQLQVEEDIRNDFDFNPPFVLSCVVTMALFAAKSWAFYVIFFAESALPAEKAAMEKSTQVGTCFIVAYGIALGLVMLSKYRHRQTSVD